MKRLISSGVAMLLLFAVAGCGGQDGEQGMEPTGDSTAMLGQEAAEITFQASLSGAAEVPGPGAPDGSGTAEIVITPDEGTVCFTITAENIGEAQAAHIHSGASGESGPPVVNFDVAANGLSGCVDADQESIDAITASPSQYYVNVHTADFGAGAIRGQLNGGP